MMLKKLDIDFELLDQDWQGYYRFEPTNVIDMAGENYVFWGGREGYNSILNTDIKMEIDHLAGATWPWHSA